MVYILFFASNEEWLAERTSAPMANYTVGEILRETRERKKCSQEEVCYGICTPSTLSRIENGIQIPGRRILEALTQRLGITDNLYTTYMGREELELYETGKRLMRSLGHGDYKELELLVQQLEQMLERIERRDYNVNLEEQYILFAKAILQKHRGAERQNVLEMMLEAIRITIPNFDGIHIKNRCLTFQEITILNNISCIYHEMGKILEAFQIIVVLKEYMEENVMDEEEKAKKYPMIIQNMVSWLSQEGRYEDALVLCESGLECCIEYGKMKVFPMLLYNKSALLAETGQLDKSRKCFLQTIAIFQAMNQHQQAEDIRVLANRDYKLNL